MPSWLSSRRCVHILQHCLNNSSQHNPASTVDLIKRCRQHATRAATAALGRGNSSLATARVLSLDVGTAVFSGYVDREERTTNLRMFNQSGPGPVILFLSATAGGVGLNGASPQTSDPTGSPWL